MKFFSYFLTITIFFYSTDTCGNDSSKQNCHYFGYYDFGPDWKMNT